MTEGNSFLSKFAVNQAQEMALMFQFTQTITRELVLAIDLMEYSMSLSNLRLPDCALLTFCRMDGRTDFDDMLRRFVELYMPFVSIEDKIPLMDQRGPLDYDMFKKYINYSGFETARLSGDGTTQSRTRAFWIFCLETVQLSIRAFQHGMRNAPHFGIMIMCKTHLHFNRMDPFDDKYPFDSMYNMAYDVVQWLEPKTHGPLDDFTTTIVDTTVFF